MLSILSQYSWLSHTSLQSQYNQLIKLIWVKKTNSLFVQIWDHIRHFTRYRPIQIIQFLLNFILKNSVKEDSTLPLISPDILDIHPWAAVDNLYPH